MTKNTGLTHDIDGYHDGECVRDTRTGMLGRVRFLGIPDDANPDEYEAAEVVWDDSFVQDGLSVAAPYLERAAATPGDDDRCPDCGRASCDGRDCYWPGDAGLRGEDDRA